MYAYKCAITRAGNGTGAMKRKRAARALCSVCTYMEVPRGRDVCSVCSAQAKALKKHEYDVMEYLKNSDDLSGFSSYNAKIPCGSSRRRPDFLYSLQDRVVVLEVDENMHRMSSAPMCERAREYTLLDDVLESEGSSKSLVIVRFNPDQKGVPAWRAYERLGKTLREAFTTEDVRFQDDGILRFYLGYDRSRIREIESQYAVMERGHVDHIKAMRQTVDEARREGLGRDTGSDVRVREWCTGFLAALKARGTRELFEMKPERAFDELARAVARTGGAKARQTKLDFRPLSTPPSAAPLPSPAPDPSPALPADPSSTPSLPAPRPSRCKQNTTAKPNDKKNTGGDPWGIAMHDTIEYCDAPWCF